MNAIPDPLYPHPLAPVDLDDCLAAIGARRADDGTTHTPAALCVERHPFRDSPPTRVRLHMGDSDVLLTTEEAMALAADIMARARETMEAEPLPSLEEWCHREGLVCD